MPVADRGFASMPKDRQKEIAAKGGRAAHKKGTAHEWTTDEARQAGKRGGTKAAENRKQAELTGTDGS